MIESLRKIAPFVIIDCGSYIANDILSAVALMESDSVLRLANCDLKVYLIYQANYHCFVTVNGMQINNIR